MPVTSTSLIPVSIRHLEFRALDIPLFVPFGISGGAQPAANNVLATVELADGTRGHGEAAPLPPYNGETQATALAALAAARPSVVGLPETDWRSLAETFRAHGGATCGSAQCAFETALLDALTRRAGTPLWRFFGGAGTSLATDMTVTTGTAAEAAAGARAILQRGMHTIKVKVGGPKGPAHDLERLAAIRAIAPDSPLILDGNAGVSRDDAATLLRGLRDRGITPALLEQLLPKDDLAGAAALVAESGCLVAADESVATVANARRIIAAKAAHVLNLKLMKDGIATALEIAMIARQSGLGLMIGGNVESVLATTVAACFATGLGDFRFADLDAPLFLAANPFEGGYEFKGDILSVAHLTAGHGVIPRV